MTRKTQREKAELFRHLHHSGNLLVLPNIWDSLGASLLQDLGYPAVATASAAISMTRGYQDGENIPFSELIAVLRSIVNAVDIPVSADIESGFASGEEQLRGNILQLIGSGIVGINIEDTNRENGRLFSPDIQVRRIRTIREAAAQAEIPLFINARTDVLLRSQPAAPRGEIVDEIVRRGKLYLDAGADCIFPILVSDRSEILAIHDALKTPINVIAVPGLPDLPELQKMGIARISFGPGLLKMAVQAMMETARQLKINQGLDAVVNCTVSSEYLKSLVR